MIEIVIFVAGWLAGLGTGYALVKWWLIQEERKEIRERKKGR